MTKPVEHKHVIIRAELNHFLGRDQEKEAEQWCRDLVEQMGMNILRGPVAAYVDREGLRGWSIGCVIETSHISIHVWDEPTPVLAQFDVYTCGSMDLSKVFYHLEQFDPIKIEYLLLDREHSLKHISAGVIPGAINV